MGYFFKIFIIFFPPLWWDALGEFKTGQGSAGGIADLHVVFPNHVKNNGLIFLIDMVSVVLPGRGFDMDFNIPSP